MVWDDGEGESLGRVEVLGDAEVGRPRSSTHWRRKVCICWSAIMAMEALLASEILH